MDREGHGWEKGDYGQGALVMDRGGCGQGQTGAVVMDRGGCGHGQRGLWSGTDGALVMD